MLIILIAWIYISFLCWTWGKLLLSFLFAVETRSYQSFSVQCFLGLAAITVVAGFLSLFMPLGGWMPQLILIAPAIFLFTKKIRFTFFTGFLIQFKGIPIWLAILFISGLLLILFMSSWQVNHPDTLAYHAQNIQWIEKFKAIPGLVHLHTRLGNQGLWFVTTALFSLKFTGIDGITFLNSTVLMWFVFFIMQRIKYNLGIRNFKNALLWLALFVLSYWSYNQIRLTASSANVDFIVGLYTWLVFYLLINARSTGTIALVLLLSAFTITLKLSAVPLVLVIIFCLTSLFRRKKVKTGLAAVLVALIIVIPYLSRSAIATGYILFPSTFPDIVNTDWKLDKERTQLESKYVTAYAKIPVEHSPPEIQRVLDMRYSQFLPIWWRNQSLADKVIIIIMFLALAVFISGLKSFRLLTREQKITLLTAFAGIIFWWIQAPDPRFAYGFLIGFAAIVFSSLANEIQIPDYIIRRGFQVMLMISVAALATYTVYRSINFFSISQVIKPLGIKEEMTHKFSCDGIEFSYPGVNKLCGDSPIPCIYRDNCDNIIFRGEAITDGFRSAGRETQ